jgi:hypothetical protein
MDHANSDKNKITGIDQKDIIINGSIQDLADITNPNQVGSVLDSSNNVISEITPLIMIINQGCKDYKDKVKALINIGADMNMSVNYYNRETTALDIATQYRNY